jgi:hypothetical protein
MADPAIKTSATAPRNAGFKRMISSPGVFGHLPILRAITH